MSKKKSNELILDYVKFHVMSGKVSPQWVVNMLNQVRP
jgi:hypothetical protein